MVVTLRLWGSGRIDADERTCGKFAEVTWDSVSKRYMMARRIVYLRQLAAGL